MSESPSGPRDSGEPGEPRDSEEPSGSSPPPQQPREAWSEVGRRFQELGRVVRGHLEPESPDSATWSPPPADDPTTDRRDDPWATPPAAGETVRRLSQTVQRLTAQAGEAARDPVVRESAQEAARALGVAVSRAAEDIAAQLRENVRSPRWSDPTRPPPTPQPPVAPVRAEDDRPPGEHP
jgi:hypothetical protein